MAGLQRLLVVVALVFGLASAFIVKDANRTVHLAENVEATTTYIDVEADAVESEFVLAFTNVPAHIVVRSGKPLHPDHLPVTRVLKDGGLILFKVTLPKKLQPKETTNFKIETITTHVTRPLPAAMKQDDKLTVEYLANAYLLSHYPVAKQKTTIQFPGTVVDVPTADGLEMKENSAELGPYTDVLPEAVQELHFVYEPSAPFIVFSEVVREIQISSWGNIAVRESVTVRNDGARLDGSWSRLEHQHAQYRGISSAAWFRELEATLPPAARSVFFRDAIGNISSSHLRESEDGSPVWLELSMRFPLMGGWKTDFEFGYDLPADQFIETLPSGDYQLNLTFSTPFASAVVEKLTVRVILPEGSHDIATKLPFEVDEESRDWAFSTLDMFGRPVAVIKDHDLVAVHNQHFQVTYRSCCMHALFKPLLLICVFLAFFAFSMLYVRIDLSLADKAEKSKEQ